MTSIRVNATYRHAPVGTGTYTRNILDAITGALAVVAPSNLLQHNAAAYWAKRAVEFASSATPGRLIHPYWATTTSKRHVIAALDLVQYKEATRLDRALMLRAAQRAGSVLVLSEATRQEIEATIGRGTIVAPPYPDREWFRAPVSRPSATGPIRIAYWGGWHPRKGMEEVCRLLEHSDIADDVELALTTRPPFHTKLNFSVHGSISTEALVGLVDQAHCSLYPSGEEGFGLPIFESLLRMRPVICRPLDVYDEFVRPGTHRVNLDDMSPSGIAHAVLAATAPDAIGQPIDCLLRPTRESASQTLGAALGQAVVA